MNFRPKYILGQTMGAIAFASVALDIAGPLRSIINWPDYLKDIPFIHRKRLVTYRLKNGCSYKARPGTMDKLIIVETAIQHVYTPKGFEIRPTDVVVDLGAQLGDFTVMAAKTASKGQVIAFEPVKQNYDLLMDNLVLNNLRNVTAFNQAVAAKDGKFVMQVSIHNTGGHSALMPIQSSVTETVTAVALQNVLKKLHITKIDFLKSDIEGGEYDVLLNLPAEALRMINKIAMEFHQIDETRNGLALKKHLEANDFLVTMKHVPGSTIGMLYAKRP